MNGEEREVPPARPSRAASDMERVGFLTRISDGKEFSLGFGSMRVGRERRADLVIADKTVSRHHADIIYESGRYVLYDHSTNGTWVNGNLVAVAQPLRERDKVKFGKIEFVFSTKSVPKSQAAGLRQVTEPERVSGSSTAIMRGGRGKGRTVRRIKRAGIVLLVLVIAAVVVYFALPEVANSVISRLPQPLQDLLSR